MDTSNYFPDRDGVIDSGALTHGELVAQHLQGARVVKAFNTMWFQHLGANGRPGASSEERQTIFLAGDDDAAKRVVADLIEQIGFAPVDTGSLRVGGRRQEPGSPLFNAPMAPSQARHVLETV